MASILSWVSHLCVACRRPGAVARMHQGVPQRRAAGSSSAQAAPGAGRLPCGYCTAWHVSLGRAFLDLTRARLARAAVDAAVAQQAPPALLGSESGSADGAPQGPLRAAVAAVLAEHRAAAEAARREPIRFAYLKAAGQVVTMLLAREADLAGMVAAGESALGASERSMRGYPARPFEAHLTEALAGLSARAPG